VVLLALRHQGWQAGELVLNSSHFRRAQTRTLGLDLVTRLAWAKERRVAQAVRVRFESGQRAVVTNFHATGSHDKRLPDAEVRRAAWFAEAMTEPDEVSVLAGDFNVRAPISDASELCGPEGYSQPGPGIDHVLVRGARRRPAAREAARPPVRAPAALRSRAPVDDYHMSWEEARAQFPVLEHFAYLNAGSFRPPVARRPRRSRRSSRRRRRRAAPRAASRRSSLCALRSGRRCAPLVGGTPEHVALTSSTSEACRIVLAGLAPGPKTIVTTDSEHFGPLGPSGVGGARARGAGASAPPRKRLDAVLAEVTRARG
jgi:hypothetical protein